MHVIKWIAWVLVVIGGLNWGLFGLFGFDVVATLFGTGSMVSSIVYSIIGLAAVVLIVFKLLKLTKK